MTNNGSTMYLNVSRLKAGTHDTTYGSDVRASKTPLRYVPVSETAQRRHLRSATGHQLVVPSYRLNSCGLRAFSVLGPRLWNSLPRLLHDTSHNSTTLLALAIL